jgi:EmrB/QacA subfamily drug resistance transporter
MESQPARTDVPPAAGPSRRRKLAISAICSSSLFIVGVDVTAVNVALPSLERDLSAGVSGLQWTVDAYTVVMAGLLMLGGSMADRFGRRRVFITGLTIFTLASLLCSLAPSVGALVASRVLQAVGASMMNPVAMSIITNTFTEPRERAQAVGVWGAVFGISMAVGPVIGGALLAIADWRAIFLINVPMGLAAILLTLRFVPESRAPKPRRFDPVGQVAVVALLAGLTYGIIEAPHLGWFSAPILSVLLVAAAALVTLVLYERRRPEPLIDPHFFRSIPFASATVIAVVAFAAFGGFLFLNTLYLQGARGFSPFEAGLATVPMALMIVVAAPISGRIVGRHGPRLPLVLAGVLLAAGSGMLVGVESDVSLPWLLGAYAAFGAGFGLVNAPITNTAVSGMPRAQAGVASAIATTSRQVGQTLGVAIAGAIIASAAATSGPGTAALSRPAWLTLTAAGVLVLLLGVLATSNRAVASARSTAKRLNPEALAA